MTTNTSASSALSVLIQTLNDMLPTISVSAAKVCTKRARSVRRRRRLLAYVVLDSWAGEWATKLIDAASRYKVRCCGFAGGQSVAVRVWYASRERRTW